MLGRSQLPEELGEENLREPEQQVQRPWGRSKLGRILEEKAPREGQHDRVVKGGWHRALSPMVRSVGTLC